MKKIDDYAKLINYIKEIYIKHEWKESDIPLAKIGTQLKSLMKDNPEYLYSAIQYTLWYMVEMEEMKLLQDDSDSFVFLIPYYYEKAKAFNIQCREIKKLAEEFDFSDNIRVVKVGNRNKKIDYMSFDDVQIEKTNNCYDWKADLNNDKELAIINDYEEMSFD